MVKELLPGLYRARIPLPESPLLYVNSYIIKASPQSLIIDTGMNRQECYDEMNKALQELEIDLNKTDFFITHMHADHIGMVDHLATGSSKVFFNSIEAPQLKTPDHWWEQLSQFAVLYGFPKRELDKLFQYHPASRYHLKNIPNVTIVKEGDVVRVGDYAFRCIETPGHSNGHICLYEEKQRVLISGDHILGDITSNVTSRYNDSRNALDDYINSLDKIYPLDIVLALPGHRNPVKNVKQRIDELKRHHKERSDEQVQILAQGEQDAYRVTTQMTWDMRYEKWEEVQATQKYFAFAEGLAHLQYLALKGRVRERELPDGKIVYSLP